MHNTLVTMAEIKDINDAPGTQNTHQSCHFDGQTNHPADNALQMTTILQSTLELNELLKLFSEELASLVRHDGISYLNKSENHDVLYGEKARHRCTYRLILMEDDLGELCLFRKTKFNKEEIQQLENTIAALVYPLRNALLYKQAVERAHRDPLTGVNNRAALDSTLEQELDLVKRQGGPLSVVMLDVDKFKSVNDTYGHIAGDAVLKRIAESMADCARGSDVIYRYGGEEFVILLRNTTLEGAKLLAERIRDAIESIIFKYEKFDIRVTASAGLTTADEKDDIDSLLRRCDEALYEAKQQGRNTIVVA